MVRLTKPQGEVILSLAVLSSGGRSWFQTELVLQERMKDRRFNHETYFKSTEKLLEKMFLHVPRLVDRRIGALGFSWSLTPAGKAVAETQLGAKT